MRFTNIQQENDLCVPTTFPLSLLFIRGEIIIMFKLICFVMLLCAISYLLCIFKTVNNVVLKVMRAVNYEDAKLVQ